MFLGVFIISTKNVSKEMYSNQYIPYGIVNNYTTVFIFVRHYNRLTVSKTVILIEKKTLRSTNGCSFNFFINKVRYSFNI